jgi:hypothetical protein
MPTGNTDPLAGAQETVVGGKPAVTVAGGYVTASGCPLGDERVTGAGHTAWGGSYICVGTTGVSLHAGRNAAPDATNATTRRVRQVRTRAQQHYG